MDKHLVDVRKVTKIFPKTLLLSRGRSRRGKALEEVSMTADQGEIVALLGENGAGKTTLLKIIATLITPTSGEVYVGGVDAIRNDKKAKELITFTTNSERSFYYRLDGWNNLRFFCGLYGMSMAEVRKNIEPYLDALSMRSAMDMAYMYMSTGMRRKLAFLRTLALKKPVMLLDEPTSNMDPVSSQQVAGILKEIKDEGQSTIILSTNNLEDAELLSDRALILAGGRVAYSERMLPADLKRGVIEIVVEGSAYARMQHILPGATETEWERGVRYVKESSNAVHELNQALDALRSEGIRIFSARVSTQTFRELTERKVEA
ncbi:MAG: ABC transporter ATP-binding protein [Methanomassiliicoccales archaeon]